MQEMTEEEEERSYTPPLPPPAATTPPHRGIADIRQSNLDRLINLIQKDPQGRTDFEAHEFVPFLKKHIEWFNNLKPELVQEIIKKCQFVSIPPETIFIKQGDLGDSMFAILQGEVTVHVIFDPENDRENFTQVEANLNKKKFTKSDFGNEVATKSGGACIGEVALISENCTRTASCITVTQCDFLIIDKELYNVSVKEVIEKEFQEKTEFVSRNPLFKLWTPRQKNQLAISLKKVKIGFGDKLVKQGGQVDDLYFIYRGDLTISIDSFQYQRQFPTQYTEMKGLLPELINDKQPSSQAPHLLRKQRLAGHKPQQICILGENETIGILEVILGLQSYMETAVSKGECEMLMLKKLQFEKMFKRKYALPTVDKLREALANKLCLYIYQSDPKNVAFLKYLNMKLMDSQVLQEVKKSKHAKARQGANIGAEKVTKSIEERDIVNLMKRLHMSSESAAELPPEDMSEIALAKMDKRLRLWSENTNMNGSKLESLQSSSITL